VFHIDCLGWGVVLGMLLTLLLDSMVEAVKILFPILLVAVLSAAPFLWWGGRLRQQGKPIGWVVALAGMGVMILVFRYFLTRF
jgi:hypothetical protein